MVVLKFSTSKMTLKKSYYEYDCSELFNWTTQMSLLCFPRYEQSDDYGRMRYEDDFLAYLQQIMSDVDRRIRRGHSRLALSNAQQNVSFDFHVVIADVAATKRHQLLDKILIIFSRTLSRKSANCPSFRGTYLFLKQKWDWFYMCPVFFC